jgi:hypothetical protein
MKLAYEKSLEITRRLVLNAASPEKVSTFFYVLSHQQTEKHLTGKGTGATTRRN